MTSTELSDLTDIIYRLLFPVYVFLGEMIELRSFAMAALDEGLNNGDYAILGMAIDHKIRRSQNWHSLDCK